LISLSHPHCLLQIFIEHITHHPGETFLGRGRKLVSFEEKPIIGIGVKDIQ